MNKITMTKSQERRDFIIRLAEQSGNAGLPIWWFNDKFIEYEEKFFIKASIKKSLDTYRRDLEKLLSEGLFTKQTVGTGTGGKNQFGTRTITSYYIIK